MRRAMALAIACTLLASETGARTLECGDEAVEGWHFYCDPEATEAPLPAPQPEQAPQASPLTATEEIEAYRKRAEELKNRAILDPTPENLEAYMQVNKEMAQMASRFAAVWQRVLFATPDLDANVKRPRTQMGINIYQDQKNEAERAALKRAAAEAGFLFVYDNPVDCRICLAQAQVLEGVRKKFGISILAVSTDGSAIEGFPDAVADDGQLSALGIADLPRPFIAIVDTQTGAVELIGGGLLTEDQILDRVYVVREIPMGERFSN